MSKLIDKEISKEEALEALSGTKSLKTVERLESEKRTHKMFFWEIKIKSGICIQARCVIDDKSGVITIGEATVVIKDGRDYLGFKSWEFSRKSEINRDIKPAKFFKKHIASR